MSRNLGQHQLKVLDWLRKVPDRTMMEIATAVFHKPDVTRNELRTIRSAVFRLERRKLIKRAGHLSHKGEECWAITPLARLRKPLVAIKGQPAS